MAVAPKGNKYAVVLKDKDLRQRAYKSFCDHLSKGKAIKSWWYEEGEYSCTWATMLSYMQDAKEFDPIHKELAESKGYNYWENVAEESAIGKNSRANTASLQMVMRNKFGWDKEVQAKPVPNDPAITELLKGIKALKESDAS